MATSVTGPPDFPDHVQSWRCPLPVGSGARALQQVEELATPTCLGALPWGPLSHDRGPEREGRISAGTSLGPCHRKSLLKCHRELWGVEDLAHQGLQREAIVLAQRVPGDTIAHLWLISIQWSRT